jgi:hypothetical protein
MLALSSRSRAIRRWNAEYTRRLEQPLQGWLTHCLDFALSSGAGAIAVGYRDPAAEAEGAKQYANAPPSISPYPIQKACDRNTRLKGPNGATTIPVWLEHSDGVFLFQFVPAIFYPHLIAQIDYRLLSIGATVDQPQPLRYIEITPSGNARRFVEIDLEIDSSNVVWIRLRGERTISPTENVSPYYKPL